MRLGAHQTEGKRLKRYSVVLSVLSVLSVISVVILVSGPARPWGTTATGASPSLGTRTSRREASPGPRSQPPALGSKSIAPFRFSFPFDLFTRRFLLCIAAAAGFMGESPCASSFGRAARIRQQMTAPHAHTSLRYVREHARARVCVCVCVCVCDVCVCACALVLPAPSPQLIYCRATTLLNARLGLQGTSTTRRTLSRWC